MPNSSPDSRTRAAVSSARLLASPPERSRGIMPSAGNRCLVFQLSRYSALPTKVIRRGSTDGSRNESITDTWLGQTRAPPRAGMFSVPSTWTRQPNRSAGVSTARATGNSHPYWRWRADTGTSAAYVPWPPRVPRAWSTRGGGSPAGSGPGQVDAEQRRTGGHCLPGVGGLVQQPQRARGVEVVVERRPHPIEDAAAGSVAGRRRLPALEPVGGVGHHVVVPLPLVAVVVRQHGQADGAGVPRLAELRHEHEVA